MKQNYGVLRVVRVRLPADATTYLQDRYPSGWLPEERLVHLLTHTSTTIGRALNNDIILMDPTVSREHARLDLDASGWHITNLTEQNIVRVNGQTVPSGCTFSMQSQDILIVGSTMLQLIAPNNVQTSLQDDDQRAADTERLPNVNHPSQPRYQPPFFDDSSTRRGSRVLKGAPRPSVSFTPPNLPSLSPRSAFAGSAGGTSLPKQPAPELVAQTWEEDVEESLLGAGVTMQFALPQRLGKRTLWFIAGTGLLLLVASAVITVVLNGLITFTALAEYGVSSVLAAIFIPAIPAVCIFLLVNFIDRFEREPWFLRLAAFLWGAIIAIPPALFIEGNVDRILQNLLDPNTTNEMLRIALQGLNAGITEETIKGLGLLLLFFVLRDEFDDVVDGIIYGALIGAGFAMVENFRYFALDSKNFLVFLIVGRIILGWLGHSTFIACFGAALGYVRYTRVRWKQIVIPLLGFLIAVGLHSFFDFVDFQASAAIRNSGGNPVVVNYALIAIIGNYLPPFLVQLGLLYILIRGLAHETAIIREFLADEVSDGIVSVGEYALLQNSFQRTHVERQVLKRSGYRQWLRVKDLYQTEIGLAFRKWHVSMGDKPKLGYLQPEDAYRQRVKRLRKEIKATEKQR